MARKDYYGILGISPPASLRRIRGAYRALAKTLHPDHVGSGGTKAFQDLVEAYEVLSDPDKRRSSSRAAPRPSASSPLASPSTSAETSRARPGPATWRPSTWRWC